MWLLYKGDLGDFYEVTIEFWVVARCCYVVPIECNSLAPYSIHFLHKDIDFER